jgi:hypothetical protein
MTNLSRLREFVEAGFAREPELFSDNWQPPTIGLP